ncbi:MAG: BlaI/MecI/CopY family transcriptional regulator [Planctomycetaceae bacterium]
MPKFTPGELNVMRLLWTHGEMKPSEIQRKFPTRIKNPALRSYLSILLEKGHVSRRLVGKAYHYRAVTKRQSAFRSMLREMVETCFDGSTQALMMTLIKSEKLSEKELLELKRMAESEPADPSPKKESKP